MNKKYNAVDWYWSGAAGIYSSAKGKIVPTNDPDYLAWMADGGVATKWPNDENDQETIEALDKVLDYHGLSITDLGLLNKAQLRKHVNKKMNHALNSGTTILNPTFLSFIDWLDSDIANGTITTVAEIDSVNWPS